MRARRTVLSALLVAGAACRVGNPAFDEGASGGARGDAATTPSGEGGAPAAGAAGLGPAGAGGAGPGGAGGTVEPPRPGPTRDASQPGVLLYLKLDEAAGSAVARDDSGLAHHGTVVGKELAAAWVPGLFGQAASWTAGAAGAIEIARSDALDRMSAGFTITAWVWLDAMSPGVTYSVVARPVGEAGLLSFGLGVRDGHGVVRWTYRTAGGGEATAPNAFKPGRWTFVALTMGGGEVRLYVDTILMIRSSMSTTPLAVDSTPIVLGNEVAGATSPLVGRIDEVAAWDVVLTPFQVEQIRQRAKTPFDYP